MGNPSVAQLLALTGKVALVTGGGGGIGAGIARRLAEAGAAVMVSDLDGNTAEQQVAGIREAGGEARSLKADASSVGEARRVVQATVETFGRLDILVNNAGIYPVSPALETSEETWDRVLDLNLKGTFFHAQAAAQQMIRQGQGGRIINISSANAYKPPGSMAHYDASKSGVVMMTRSLALELARHNINVNAVAPGGVLTEGAQQAMESMGREAGCPPEQVIQGYIQRIPLHRLGTPDDIARMVLCLAAAPGDYITGHTVSVDGGLVFA